MLGVPGCSSVGSGKFTQAGVDGFDGVGGPFQRGGIGVGEVGEQDALGREAGKAAVCSSGAFVRVPPCSARGFRALGVTGGTGTLIQPRPVDRWCTR